MRDSLLKYLAAREELVEVGGHKVTVREIGPEVDTSAFRDGVDSLWKFITRSTFDEKGDPVFTDADIPALKLTAKIRLVPLIEAVSRVNRLNRDDEIKNSDAVPGSG